MRAPQELLHLRHAATRLSIIRTASAGTASWSIVSLAPLAVPSFRRPFSSSVVLYAKALPPRQKVNEDDLTEKFLKGSGPGGQKINKTSSAVQLHHTPTGTVIKCQATRSRSQNRTIARRLLAEKLEEKEKGPESRTQLKAEIARKKKASKIKKARRKYKALVGEQEEDEGGEEEEGEDGDVEVEDSGGGVHVVENGEKAEGQEEVPEWERRWRELRGIK